MPECRGSPPCGGVDWNIYKIYNTFIAILSPPCGGVDWNLLSLKLIHLPKVTTLRWCGLKYPEGSHQKSGKLSPPCGGVDWNSGMTWKQNARQCHHLAVVWIEIVLCHWQWPGYVCHHLAVMWIEISTFRLIDSYWAVTTLWWCELKFYKSPPLLYNRVITSK